MEKNIMSSIELLEERLKFHYKDLYDHLTVEFEKMLQIDMVRDTHTNVYANIISISVDFDRMLDSEFKVLLNGYLNKKGYTSQWTGEHILNIKLYI